MDQALAQLGRAVGVHATVVHLALGADHGAVALGAQGREVKIKRSAGVIGVLDRLDDLGNHIAAALDTHPIAHQQAEALDEVGVVQRGAAYRGAADEDRRQFGHGRQLAGAAYLYRDSLDLRHARFGRELVSNGPARGAAGIAKALLGCMRVHLEYHAVDLVAQRGALNLCLVDEAGHLLDRGDQHALGIDTEAESSQRIEGRPLALRPVIAAGD